MKNQVWVARSSTGDSLCGITTAQLLFSSGESGITLQMDISHSEEIQNYGTTYLQVYFHLKTSSLTLNNLLLKKILIPDTFFPTKTVNKFNIVQNI